MDDQITLLLKKYPLWKTTLEAYWQLQQQAAAAAPGTGRWTPRLHDIAGVPGEQISSIHGRLLAHGLLACEMAEGKGGLLYQLTLEGRQALNGPSIDLSEVTADVA